MTACGREVFDRAAFGKVAFGREERSEDILPC
jgi:hypothetical protein